jgi:hypothetical protein
VTDWQITAKTIYCEAVDDEVTILVYRDAPTRCTGYRKYESPNDITRRTVKQKTRRLKRPIKCEGEGCPRVMQYKEQITAEENL